MRVKRQIEVLAVERQPDVGRFGAGGALDRGDLNELRQPGCGLPDHIVEAAIDLGRPIGAADHGAAPLHHRGRGETAASLRPARRTTGGARIVTVEVEPSGDLTHRGGGALRGRRDVDGQAGRRRRRRNPAHEPRRELGRDQVLRREELVAKTVDRCRVHHGSRPHLHHAGGDLQIRTDMPVGAGHQPDRVESPRHVDRDVVDVARVNRAPRGPAGGLRAGHGAGAGQRYAGPDEIGADRLGDPRADPVVLDLRAEIVERRDDDRAGGDGRRRRRLGARIRQDRQPHGRREQRNGRSDARERGQLPWGGIRRRPEGHGAGHGIVDAALQAESPGVQQTIILAARGRTLRCTEMSDAPAEQRE